jgi:hypothetical protein
MVGIEEVDQDKLTPLLRLKHHDFIADARSPTRAGQRKSARSSPG